MPRYRRGKHSRNWIWFVPWGETKYAWEREVLHEEECTTHHGWFGVVEHYESYFIVWRQNRNHRRPYAVYVMDGTPRYEEGVTKADMGEHIEFDSLEAAVEEIRWYMFNWCPPQKKGHRKMRDSQKGRVYKWEAVSMRSLSPVRRRESKWPSGDVTVSYLYTLTHIRTQSYISEMMKRVCRELGETPPTLKFRTGGAASKGGKNTIRLLPVHLVEYVLLHELAHTFHHRWREQMEQGHGKEFVGVYFYLLVRFGGVDEADLVDTLRQHGVNYQLPSQYYEWRSEQERAA